MARDFDWLDRLYAVVKEDGTFAGIPCTNFEEAKELSAQHEGSHIYIMALDDDNELEVYDDNYDFEPSNIDDDCGFDPYMGEYTYDC